MNKRLPAVVLVTIAILSLGWNGGCTTIAVTPTNSATQVIQTARALVTVFGAQTAAANNKTQPAFTPTAPSVPQAIQTTQSSSTTPTKAATQFPQVNPPTSTRQSGAQATATPAPAVSDVNFKDAKVYIAFISETRSQISVILPNETLKKTAGFNASSGGQTYTCGDLISITNTIRIICTGPRLKSGTLAKVSFYLNGITTPAYEGSATVP